ncbi:GNAT family N-acetyltransferase [Paenibacillus sp. YIM B09110]|uniref:GNAT family N-acetyltransferase n=1 Tax=Paenibacillus sp. YIM B09110 TaxID=3126102 RepID=UPI00301BBF9D
MTSKLSEVAGSANFIFPPNIADIRPFLWSGFKSTIKYTYHSQFPYLPEQVDSSIRSKIKKANSNGYYSVKTDDIEAVFHCLEGTEARQGFSHQITVRDLQMARELLGDEAFRCYVSYSKEGEPVSSCIILRTSAEHAFGWIAGSKSEHLTKGVVQQLQDFAFDNLSANGVKEFDFSGANIESVSESKSYWKVELRPYYGIRLPGYKDVIRAGRDWMARNKKQKIIT